MGFLGQQLFDKVHKPYCYIHNDDDTFACFPSRNKALKFFLIVWIDFILVWLSLWRRKMTICYPFLTCWLKRVLHPLSNSVYRKPTFTTLYISWDSFVLKSRKINLVKHLTHQTLMICSKSRIDTEIEKISMISSKCPIHVKLLWIGTVSQLFADKNSGLVMCCFNSIKVRTVFTPRPTFQSSPKDILLLLQESIMDYKSQCQCDV